MIVMIINRCKAGEEDRPAIVRFSPLLTVQNARGTQRISLDRKLLGGFELPPSEVACFRERPHLIRRRRKPANTRQEFTVEEFSKRLVFDRLELGHVNLVLGNKRLNFPSTPPTVLVSGDEPVIQAPRLKPLCKRTSRPAVVRSRMIVHEFFDQLAGLAVPNRQWERLPTHSCDPADYGDLPAVLTLRREAEFHIFQTLPKRGTKDGVIADLKLRAVANPLAVP